MNAQSKQTNVPLALNHEQKIAAFLNVFTFVTLGFLLFGPQFLPGIFVTIVLGVVPAVYMTWYLNRYPDSLRNRKGSLATAINLVAFLWLVSVASVVGILAGFIE